MNVIFGLLVGFSLVISAYANETVTVYKQNNTLHEAFILFYMKSCPHCRRFDPVLKEYAVNHHIPVLAYTLDGRSLPSFPKSVLPTQSEMNRFFPDRHPVVPTLFLMNLDQHKIIPVLQGEAKAYQLDRRMQQIHAGGSSDEI